VKSEACREQDTNDYQCDEHSENIRIHEMLLGFSKIKARLAAVTIRNRQGFT